MTEWGMENPQVKGAHQMPTFEDAQATGEANHLIENNLSKVKIIHNSKGLTSWEISVKHEDANKAKGVAMLIDKDLRDRYESK